MHTHRKVVRHHDSYQLWKTLSTRCRKKFGRYDWSISINDSWWQVSTKNNVIVGNGDTKAKIDKEIKQILGKTIKNIQTSTDFSQTTLTFDDDLSLTCKHKPTNKFEDWSLPTPEEMYIKVGPKHKWLHSRNRQDKLVVINNPSKSIQRASE